MCQNKTNKGPLRECRSIRSGASGLPYYCAPLVCVSDIMESLAVWRHNKPKNQNPKPRGGFIFHMLSDQEPGGRKKERKTEEEDPPKTPCSTWYKFFEGGPLPLDSWPGTTVNSKPPARGGGLRVEFYWKLIVGICVDQIADRHCLESRDSLLEPAQEAVVLKSALTWAQYVWQQRHVLSVCFWFQDCENLCLESTVCVLPPPHRSLNNYFSILLQFFSPNGPSIFWSARFTK